MPPSPPSCKSSHTDISHYRSGTLANPCAHILQGHHEHHKLNSLGTRPGSVGRGLQCLPCSSDPENPQFAQTTRCCQPWPKIYTKIPSNRRQRCKERRVSRSTE